MFIGLVYYILVMTETVSYITFERAKTNAKDVKESEGPINAIDLTSNSAFYALSKDPDNEEVDICVENANAYKDEIDVLEIAFVKGKLRKTKFSVDYINDKDEKHHVGTYESNGKTSNYQKFIFPEKVKDIKGLLIKFKGNNDGYPWFAIKGIRLAKFVEKTL